MKPTKYKFLKRYKKVENFLKGHPFWPSFLSNGGLLSVLLVISIVFTIICGRNSVRDIVPELKVMHLEFSGQNKTWLDHINITHDVDKERKEFKDLLIASYGITDEVDISRMFDDSGICKRIATEYGVKLDKSSLISKMNFRVNNDIEFIDMKYNAYLDDKASFDTCISFSDTIDLQQYSKYLICCKDSLNKGVFEDAYAGNFIASSRRNPYIYFNFHLDGNFLLDANESILTFVFSERDEQFRQALNPVNILHVFPEPTYQSPSYILYKGEDLAKVIRNNGFTFLGEDLSIKQDSDKKTFLWTVLFGTVIAVTIDILVNLIIKWRNIIPRKRRRR